MIKNKLSAWIAISIASYAAFAVSNSMVLALFVAFILAALLTPLRTFSLLRDNTVDAELNLNVILSAAISAFRRAVFPITVFANIFRNVQLKGTNKVAVPYYPLETTASRDFNQDDGYVFDDDSATQVKEITINKRKYQPLRFTSSELARIPMLNAQKIGTNKGEKIAYDVLQDILSIFTAANGYTVQGTPADITPGNYDSNAVIGWRTSVGKVPWPTTGRGLLTNVDLDGALLNDNAFKAAYSIGTDQVIRTGMLPNIFGFDYSSTPAIPALGTEHLIGLLVYASACLVAFSPIEPADSIKKLLVDHQIATDPETQISLEYRHWGDPDHDTDKRVIECNYGFDKGELAAARLIHGSTAP
jgi:type II secretory pathway pseudopilin PulG